MTTLHNIKCGRPWRGPHIECGMPASLGAIETVFIDPASYRVDCQMIGNDALHPKGLCGSGIIDAVAEMVKAGLILPSGRLCEGLPGIHEDENGIGLEFVIANSNVSSGHIAHSLSVATYTYLTSHR